MKSRRVALELLGVSLLLNAGFLIAVAHAGPDRQPPADSWHIYSSRLAEGESDGWVYRSGGETDRDTPDPRRDLVPEWFYHTAAPCLSGVRIADVDGDGVKDIVLTTYDPIDPYSAGRVYVIDINGNDLPGWPVTTVGPIPASPAVADIDNNGDMEVIVGSWSRAYVWNHDGTNYPGWPQYMGSYNSPAVADVDDDGDLEIIYTTTSKRLYVLDHDGSTLPGWPYVAPELVGSPAVADIDGDGSLEIAAGTYKGPVDEQPFEVYVWETDGSVVGGFPVSTSGVVKAAVALGDIDADGEVEIVATAYHTSNNDYLYVWDAQGNLEAGWPVRATYIRLSSPALGDLDGDGDLEIVIGGLYPTDFIEKMFAFHHDGTAVAGWPVILDHSGSAGNINSSPIIADIDGNTDQVEVVVKVSNYFFALHADGTLVDGFPYYLSDENHGGTFSPSPAVGDLDGDGDVEYVFVSNYGKIEFFDEEHSFSEDLAFWPMFKHDAHNTGYLPPLGQEGDLNGDGCVDQVDLGILLADWGCTGGDCPGDCDGDGDTDHSDLGVLLAHWGEGCP